MSEPRLIQVWMGDIDGRKSNAERLAGQRIYATRQAIRQPFGAFAPPPESAAWELAADEPVVSRGGRVYFPEFELEPTAQAPGRVRFYAALLYGRDGRDEQGRDGNAFVLPHGLGRRVHLFEVFGYTVRHFPYINTR